MYKELHIEIQFKSIIFHNVFATTEQVQNVIELDDEYVCCNEMIQIFNI